MTQPSGLGGGRTVKASSLNLGDYIRDPKKRSRILVVVSKGSNVFARGLDEDDTEHHFFLDLNSYVELVTDVTTETSVLPKEGEVA